MRANPTDCVALLFADGEQWPTHRHQEADREVHEAVHIRSK